MIIENPGDTRIQAEVDRTHHALRTTLRPLEYRSAGLVGGHYRTALVTGLTTVLNTGDALASIRWSNVTFRALIHKIEAFASIRTAFGTAQELSVDLVRVTNFITADAGGTAIAFGLTNRKAPGIGMTPALANMRVASATAVTAGASSVEDANPMASVAFDGLTNTLGMSGRATLYEIAPGEHPIVLDSQEGLRIRLGLTQGATGVVVYRFNIDWSEVPIEAFPAQMT